MPISPEDIERAVFKERFRGYDQDEVDRFLDQVAGGIEALRAERDELAAQVLALRGGRTAQDPESSSDVDHLLKRTLNAAQQTAEELVADARRQAAELLDTARRETERDRDQVRAEAELVRRAVGELERFRGEYRSRLHAVMSEQLAALDRAGELPRLPALVQRVAEAGERQPAQPSSARAWAESAAVEPEPVAAGPTDDEAAPWDELWDDAPANRHDGGEIVDDDGGRLPEDTRDPVRPDIGGPAGEA